ncbi:hypothetical protein [Georhizobium profundi]|uniref:hypothetical protein n=1 Tax=Georhizobium profundi TaxID=2341112 RepID=UPI000F7E4CB8|nr:hypothetical protein [Georhizobium profundi]
MRDNSQLTSLLRCILAMHIEPRHHSPMTDLILKWRRSYPDSDQHFQALDPGTFGEVPVLNIIRNNDSTGIPTDWHWILIAPGVIGNYPGANQGDAPATREAAEAGEAAYQAFRAWITPEALERANQQAQDVIAGQKQWARQHRNVPKG